VNGAEIDLQAIHGSARSDGGVEHGARLVAFTEAVMGSDDEALKRERQALRAVLSDDSFVDVAATIGAFNVVTRIADSTGIPLDPMLDSMSVDVRQELRLARFASSANTPGAS
jgi:hypothetical protein